MNGLRKLTKQDVEFTIEAKEDYSPIRGNLIDSGDSDYDTQIENEIVDRLNSGDIWAWCSIKVTAYWNGLDSVGYLGGCSYESESDFIKNSGYYDAMCEAALADLNKQVESLNDLIDPLRVIFVD